MKRGQRPFVPLITPEKTDEQIAHMKTEAYCPTSPTEAHHFNLDRAGDGPCKYCSRTHNEIYHIDPVTAKKNKKWNQKGGTRKNMATLITVNDIATMAKTDPKRVRRLLRKRAGKAEGKVYSWPKGSAEVNAIIKELTAPKPEKPTQAEKVATGTKGLKVTQKPLSQKAQKAADKAAAEAKAQKAADRKDAKAAKKAADEKAAKAAEKASKEKKLPPAKPVDKSVVGQNAATKKANEVIKETGIAPTTEVIEKAQVEAHAGDQAGVESKLTD